MQPGWTLALAVSVTCACAGVDQSGRARTSDGRRDGSVDAPWTGHPCDAGSVRMCPEVVVDVPSVTPVGTLVFDRASFTYEVAFGYTYVQLAPGDPNALPQLRIAFDGQPVTGALGAGGPGDHSAAVTLSLCDGSTLQAYGVVHVYANEVTLASEAGTEAHLDIALRLQSPGWRIDSRFEIPTLCAIVGTP